MTPGSASSDRLHVVLGSSRTLACAIAAGHLLTAFAVALVEGSPAWRLGLLALACACARHAWRHDVTRAAAAAVVAIAREPGGAWTLHTRAGARLQVRPAAQSLVHPRLSLLVWHAARGRRTYLTVCPDAIDPQAYRILRVALRAPDAPGPGSMP